VLPQSRRTTSVVEVSPVSTVIGSSTQWGKALAIVKVKGAEVAPAIVSMGLKIPACVAAVLVRVRTPSPLASIAKLAGAVTFSGSPFRVMAWEPAGMLSVVTRKVTEPAVPKVRVPTCAPTETVDVVKGTGVIPPRGATLIFVASSESKPIANPAGAATCNINSTTTSIVSTRFISFPLSAMSCCDATFLTVALGSSLLLK